MQENPYSPPASHIAGASNQRDGFVHLASRLLPAKLALVLAILSPFSIDILELTAGEEFGRSGMSALVALACILLTIGSIVLAAILYCRWLHRAVSNVPALDGFMSYTPSASVWSFFIPFVNLVKPYRVVSELWTASDPEANSDSGIVALWWGALWVGRILAKISSRLGHDSGSSIVGLISSFVDALAGVACISIMEEITRRQTRTAERLELSPSR